MFINSAYAVVTATFWYYMDVKRRLFAIITDRSVQRFLIVGLISFGVDYGLLLILLYRFQVALGVATTEAYVVGLMVNFVLNKFWTFSAPKGARQSTRQAFQYGLLVVLNLFLTNVIIEGCHALNVGPELSKPVATGLIMVLNYVVYNRIIFRVEPPIEPFAG